MKLMKDGDINPEVIEWSRNLFRVLEDGGRWAIPRTGIVLQKRGDKFVLIGQMPERDRKKVAASPNDIEHRFTKTKTVKVITDKILSREQRWEYLHMREVFEKAGITMENETLEMPYLLAEHGTYIWGISKTIGLRTINQRLGMSFNHEDAIRDLVMQGFDLANMAFVHGARPAAPPKGFA